ncbi:sensor domain-containing diguanylate cyclase [Rhodococcus sp. SORGH_AS_0301]|uniref:GGDEF domain-containing protein n=1 Tax=Rhodococcus sp. SORGH_AS_0301 TaxID=3041780 RepID=UPI0027866059|nr:sensor domain-containing diguanylate cyclase [Rhodococcus sp. SORGH_AS_0301]MDQ1181959.1 diguanylate cyclase (GGDEF)-like protein/PAS domain S-box-containing protein [Rhodococcus sp. SORGH_AS_0301]
MSSRQVDEGTYQAMFDASTVPMALADECGLLVLANDAYCRLVGRSWDDIAGLSSRGFTHPDDIAQHVGMERLTADADRRGEILRVEKRYLRPDGEIRWGWVSTTSVVTADGTVWTMAVIHDITDRRTKEDALAQAVMTDGLTGLLNRRGWRERVQSLVGKRSLVLAMLDFDLFKSYNDAHGHAAGDALLVGFADAATRMLGPDVVLARWGGEEFAMAVPGGGPEGVTAILTRLIAVMPEEQTFSAGWAMLGVDEDIHDCLDRADHLLYSAKRDGGRGRTYGDRSLGSPVDATW